MRTKNKIIFFLLSFIPSLVISQTKIEEKEGYIYVKEGESQVQLAMPEEMKDADAYIIKLNKLTDTKSINADILNRSKKLGLFKKNKDDLKKGLLTETMKIELIKKSNEGSINKDELKLLNQLKEDGSNKNNLEVLKNLAVESYLKKANDAYNQKNYKKALHYSELANQLDSKNYRIKAMIGSLHYRLGNDKLAKKYWTNSLKFNSNQPSIKLYLRKIK